MAHRPAVKLVQQLADGPVQIRQTEEGLVAQPGQDPPLHYLDADFDLGLVSGLANPGGSDHGLVVLRQVEVGGIQVRLIAARAAHTGLEVVRDQKRRNPTEEREGAHMGPDPVGQILVPVGLGVGVAARPEHSHKHLRRADLTRLHIHHRHRLTGIVHEELLAPLVAQPHGRVERLRPLAIELTELTVALALRISLPVFQPQQPQGHPLASQFRMDLGPIRHRDGSSGRASRRREEKPEHLVFAQLAGDGPGQAGRRSPLDIVAHCAGGDAATPADGPVTQPEFPLQPKDFKDLAHGQSLLGHHLLLVRPKQESARIIQDYPASPAGQIRVLGMRRNP
jgi:hypothetical protein